jgi:glycosyltransferase involved in cell wall biosynthesis
MDNMKVIAAMPAYNVEPYIGSVVLKAKRHVDKVIVVDDGSTDATATIAKTAGAHVVSHDTNRGYGAAIKYCFETAKRYKPDVLVILDSDGQHDPDEIPQVIAPIVAGNADLVIGSRFLRQDTAAQIPTTRRVGLRVLTTVSNIGAKTKVTDSQSGFRAFSRRALDKLNFRRTGMSVGSEILMNAQKLGLRIAEVPITCRYEGVGKSTERPMYHGFSVLNFVLKVVRQRHPLLFFGLPGVIFFIIGVVLGIWSMNIYYTGSEFPVGKAMLSVLLILIGILALFTALILETLKNIVAGIR